MWAESRLLSRLFHFKCFTSLRKYLALHKQKTDILWEWQQTGWGDILVWWTEQRCGVKSIFWWLTTWLDLTWDTMTRLCLFSDFSLFLCCRLAVTVTLLKTEFKKAFVKSWLHLFHWISVNQSNLFSVTSFKENKHQPGIPNLAKMPLQ